MIAGIDWSSQALDVVIIPADADHGDADIPRATIRHAAIPQEKHARARRPGHAAFQTVEQLADVAGYPVTTVYVEEGFTHRWNAAAALWPIQGAICAAAWRPGRRDVLLVPPNTWRAWHDLPRQASKAVYIDAARAREPSLPHDITDHTAEAYLIALAGRAMLNGRRR
jgi:hypothetical protein